MHVVNNIWFATGLVRLKPVTMTASISMRSALTTVCSKFKTWGKYLTGPLAAAMGYDLGVRNKQSIAGR
jgi:hypothetical protein